MFSDHTLFLFVKGKKEDLIEKDVIAQETQILLFLRKVRQSTREDLEDFIFDESKDQDQQTLRAIQPM